MEALTRAARSTDISALKSIWRTVFGDTDVLIDLFFRHYGAETAAIVSDSGEIAAAGYLLPVGSIRLPNGGVYPCAMIYSVAVLPGHQGRGLGTELTRALVAAGHAAGYPAVVLCPASDELFGYYSRAAGLREWFYASERGYTIKNLPSGNGKLVRVTTGEYACLREAMLAGIAHIEMDERALSFQNGICELMGGGLFAITQPGREDACAIIERGETVCVKELLLAGGTVDTVAAIAGVFPAEKYLVRTSARESDSETVRRFGMLAADSGFSGLAARYNEAWYGPSFD